MVEGADALTYVQSQVSQDLRPLAVGDSVYSLVLQPTGKVDALIRVLRSGEHALILDMDAGYGEAVMVRLNRFKIRVAADITQVSWQCLAVRGPDASGIAATPGSVAVAAWWGDASAVDLLGPAPQPPTGIAAGSLADLEAARVAAGWPRHGAEILETSLPAELGVLPVAVSFTKGCYPGQELVERMDSRGAKAPRQLRRLTVDTGTAVGDPVIIEGTEVGRITSVAGTRAIALVKRDVEIGEAVAPPA
jgi:folate-binding protein YgfZ